jgi:hypothetical protein
LPRRRVRLPANKSTQVGIACVRSCALLKRLDNQETLKHKAHATYPQELPRPLHRLKLAFLVKRLRLAAHCATLMG